MLVHGQGDHIVPATLLPFLLLPLRRRCFFPVLGASRVARTCCWEEGDPRCDLMVSIGKYSCECGFHTVPSDRAPIIRKPTSLPGGTTVAKTVDCLHSDMHRKDDLSMQDGGNCLDGTNSRYGQRASTCVHSSGRILPRLFRICVF